MIKAIKSLIPKDRPYHVAVSMGSDSVAALLWMVWKGYRVVPLHFNHHLRAQNGSMHERFFDICKEFNLEGKSDVGFNLKTEDECRQARLDFYRRAAQGGTVVTAHHLGDWIEGYLLNCFRGHPNHEPIPLSSEFDGYMVAHPFLTTRKRDFREFLERNGWYRWVVEDSSNGNIKGSRRNWVRHAIIPQMEQQKLSLEKYARRKIAKLLEGSNKAT